MLGVFSAGLVLGALGFYAVTHRSEIARALTSNEVELHEYNGAGDPDRVSVTTHRPGNRRKAPVENS
jgi:hypothetical protein